MDKQTSQSSPASYNTVEVDGLDTFYREASDPSKPTTLLQSRGGENGQPYIQYRGGSQ